MHAEPATRMTKQRKLILEELRKLKTHPTADEIYEMVRRQMPRISLGTVYRNLDVLHRIGMIRKLDMAGNQAQFDGNMDNHHHMRCIRCGCLVDIEAAAVRPPEVSVSGASHLKITGYRLEFEGLCAHCRGSE